MHMLAARSLSGFACQSIHETSPPGPQHVGVGAFRGHGRQRPGRLLILFVLMPALVAIGSAARAADNPRVTPQLIERSVSTIRHVLDREQRFVKVHAAEYLLSLGYTQGVREAFDK